MDRNQDGASVPLGSYLKVRVIGDAAGGHGDQLHAARKPEAGGGETIPADDPRFPPGDGRTGHVLREDREAITRFHYEHAPGAFAAEYVVLAEFAGEFRSPRPASN